MTNQLDPTLLNTAPNLAQDKETVLVGGRATLAAISQELGHNIQQGMNSCPFHDDKTPSCSVDLQKNVFRCFGCNAKGGTLAYVRHALNTDDIGAKKWLKEHFPIKASKKLELPKPEGKLDQRFLSPDLLVEIWKRLDQRHKLDHKEKVALFIIRLTAELPNEKDHCSAALKGDSSSGKDNAIHTILSEFPAEESFFLTRGTQSALEEEAARVKCIAFSEINKHREDGANAELTEFFKQLSEGGVNVIRRDQNTHEIVNIRTGQKTLLYGTTEVETDEELATRYVVLPIRGGEEKNRIVVASTLDNAAIPTKQDHDESWIASSIRTLRHDVDVLLPFAPALKEGVFDLTKERIKRDVKRLLSLTKAVAWLYQQQRVMVKHHDREYILAEPTDFLITLQLFEDFFNSSYEGFDPRFQPILEAIKELSGTDAEELRQKGFNEPYLSWAIRQNVWKKTGLNSETFTKRLKWLANNGYVERYYDKQVNGKISLLQVGIRVGTQLGILGTVPTQYLLDTYLDTHQKRHEIYGKKMFIPITPLPFINPFISSAQCGETFSEKYPVPAYPVKSAPDVSVHRTHKERFFTFLQSGEKGMRPLSECTRTWPEMPLERLQEQGEIYEPLPGFLAVQQ